MKHEKWFRTFVLTGLLVLAVAAAVLAAQQVTLTTFYPAPFGEYVNLVVRDTVNAGALRFSPSTAGFNVDPELVIQSGSSVAASTNASFHISRNALFTTASNTFLPIDNTIKPSQIFMGPAGNILFRSGTVGSSPVAWTTHMIINTVSNFVGIGVGAPSQQLHVAGRIRTDNSIQINSANPFLLFTKGVDVGRVIGETAPDPRISITDVLGSTSFLSVITGGASVGRVGIGRTNPTELLEIQGAGTPALYINSTTAGSGARIVLENTTGTACHAITVTSAGVGTPGTLGIGAGAACP